MQRHQRDRPFNLGDLGVAVLDVGQGQCVLVRTGRFFTLVDCGGDSRGDPRPFRLVPWGQKW